MSRDLRAAVVASRIAGETLSAIGARFGISAAMARHYCRQAVRHGEVSMETVRLREYGNRLPDVEYHKQWIQRIKARCIVDANGCWLWQGQLNANGYGQNNYRSRVCIISRMMFQAWNGVKLQRLEYVCHSCDVKRCCNPAHLWKGNNGLNKKDETAKGRNFWAKKTHCPKGHEYTPENTRYHECRPGVMSRNCFTCQRERSKSPEGRAYRRMYARRKRAELREQRRHA